MQQQTVIIEKIILSALITLVAAIATHQDRSSINGLSFLNNITPLAELDSVESNHPLYPTHYTLSKTHSIKTQD